LTITQNGRPGIVFDGVNDTMTATSWGTISQPFSRHYVATKRAATGHLINSETGTPNNADYAASGAQSAMFATSVGPVVDWANTTSGVLTSTYNGASSSFRLNGISGTSANPGPSGYAGVRIGSYDGATLFHGADMYELIITLSPLASPNVVERNQGSYYGISVA
jgi:trimeric autotransporter adhesin